jgi:uncharacterized protein
MFFQNFLQTFIQYGKELFWPLVIGFALSGYFYRFIPLQFVERYLKKKGFTSILMAAIFGAIIPVCCMGALPIAVTLRRMNASLGAVMAFLITTPATSAPALLICWKLLGLPFTIVIAVAAITIGITVGMVCDGIALSAPELKDNCCDKDHEHDSSKDIRAKMKEAFVYGFITLPKSIGLEIIFGITVSSFIINFPPIQEFIKHYMAGLLGYLIIIIYGLLDYVCSTASVPLADGLIKSGLSQGQALTYLLLGPITAYGTILVIKKEFGGRILFLYLFIICVMSFLFGITMDIVHIT